MGVLKTNLTISDATKIVVVEVVDKEDCYEIAHVYGNNEDFDIVCHFPLNIPTHYGKIAVNNFLQVHNDKNLPVFTCKISHNKSAMTREEAFNKILTATNAWKTECKNLKISTNEKENEIEF